MAIKVSSTPENAVRRQALADDIHERIHELLSEVMEDRDLSGMLPPEQAFWTASGLVDGVTCALLTGCAPDPEAQRALLNFLIDLVGEHFLKNAKFFLQANGRSIH